MIAGLCGVAIFAAVVFDASGGRVPSHVRFAEFCEWF